MVLNFKRIEELASKKKVRRIAVENFLMSLEGLTQRDAMANLSMDARLYKWNAPTQAAIRTGINETFR